MKGDDRRETLFNAAESKTPSMRGSSMRENRETQVISSPTPTEGWSGGGGRSGKATRRTPDMYVAWESDGPIVPAKRANKARTLAAELVEERGSPKGNADHEASPRTQSR